ncbi:hypothetical protein ACET3Z_028747 [Daucus carota]
MPLVRVAVRNEYGLGMAELYKEQVDKEDPKALLDGVAVAGLVGILRQLGDLAEFAAEVFHGLQEQVMNTSSRSHKLMVRAQKIEAAVSPLEKTLLAQRSHIHFAYTTGSQWHAHIQSERNHFIHSDLPLFVMDSYEECRGPPRLHLLDKFDTGGPGSCLKRYSDPNFFKRASAGYDDAYAEKLTRDKKARRRKKGKQKKRTWIQNVDGPPHVNHPTSSHSGRMHYASQSIEETSPFQTFSTYDAASKLEMGNHSKSFDSRTVSGYEECVFSPKFDGHEFEDISSPLTMNHSDPIDTSSPYEQSRAVADSIQEPTGARSSGVSWDEKVEIVEPTGQHYRYEETLDVPPNFDPDSLGEATNFKSEYCSNDSTPKSVPGINQLDDIDSETDNYMDALNTIESEPETDLECQTKRELEQFSALSIMAVDESINGLKPQHMNSASSNVDSSFPSQFSTNVASSEDNHNSIPLESDCFVSEKTSIVNPSSSTSECYVKVQSPCDTGKSSVPDSLPSSDLIEGDDINCPNTETVVRNLSSSDSTKPVVQPLKGDMVLSSSIKSEKSPSLPSGVAGINFWTNGGLLGLQPSKPPDFSALDSVHDDSVVPSTQSNIVDGEANASETSIFQNLKLSKQVRSAKITSFHNDQEDSISIMKTSLRSSQPHSNSMHELTTTLHNSFSSSQSNNLLTSETGTMVLGTKKQDYLDVEAAKSLESSSRIFEVGNNIFSNGQGKASSFSDDNRLSSSTTGISERHSMNQAFQNFSGRAFIEQFGSGYPFISPSSSPPLENMKISFQPIEGFEISKLKLKFPDGSGCHESSRDMFPSFQLVPEESISLQDVGSDSDDDTFCESSHGSEDCLGRYSESDSEEWETRESTRCNDDAIYDAFCENSTESVSSNLDIGKIDDGLVTNISGQNLSNETVMEHTQTDLPSFEILNNSFRKDLHDDFEMMSELDSEFSKDPTPPPPLPPVEWRGMKPNPDMSSEKQVPSFQGPTHEYYNKLSTSTISQQPKPAPFNHENFEAGVCTTNSKHQDGQKLNVQKVANQSINSKVVDEKEDFLQQIRTKSFSLRPTITERPNLAANVPAKVSVTAILEKANAIRQAVASDDDSWSED